MADQFATRRYLLNFDTRQLGQVVTDVLVIGAGVAGLRAAIEASESTHVIIATKDRPIESNTSRAQGGVAIVLDPADSIESHISDTLRVACGLGHSDMIRHMASEGATCLEELTSWGAKFDEEDGQLAMGMEGGHSSWRVVHAMGDATGKELSRILEHRARHSDRIRFFESCFLIDLVVHDGACVGVLTHHEKYGHQIIWARQIVLASGGAGSLYRETTNAPTATADGHAMAFRAGVTLQDMEFVQFHPTALYIAGASRALVSEAVRGEGAYLTDRSGDRFMPACHPDAELAPRDVVSRSITRHMADTSTTCVYLDARHFPPGRFAERFPGIAALCRGFDIDVERDMIPVRPAAHYTIGGVAVDHDGKSSIPGLLACGEVAATGVHGANRLASNSLLEGLVFGKRVGRTASESTQQGPMPLPGHVLDYCTAPSLRTELDLPDVRNSLRALCWRNLGIDRTEDRLVETIEIIDFWGRYVMDKVLKDRTGWETQNMLTVARCIATSAIARTESRGVHFRSDYPKINDAQFRGHNTIRRADNEILQGFAPLEG